MPILPDAKLNDVPPRHGFGASGLGNLGREIEDSAARETLDAAWDAGFRYYDTAPLYGYGLSELRLGQFLRGKPRQSFALSTKVGRYLVPPRGQKFEKGIWAPPLELMPIVDYSYDATMRSLEQSHSRLGIASFDIVYIHDIDRRNHGAAYGRQYAAAVEGAYRALAELRADGFIKAVGIGVNESDVAADFIGDTDLDLVMLAGRYTLLEQGALDDCLPLAQSKGVGVVAVGIFNSGILAKGPRTNATYDYGAVPPAMLARVEALDALCREHGVPLAAAAAQFPLAHPAVRSVVLGMSRPRNVVQSANLLARPIPPAFWSALRGSGLVAETAPLPS